MLLLIAIFKVKLINYFWFINKQTIKNIPEETANPIMHSFSNRTACNWIFPLAKHPNVASCLKNWT